MNQTFRRVAPVLASIAIIIVIAVLRDRFKALAAITATMPVNVALGLWLVYVADGTDQATVVSFSRSMFAGVVATLIWLLAVWLAARAGWGLGRLLLVGYAAWGVAVGAMCVVQSLLGVGPVLPR
jgi:hypothetical protein